VEFDPNPAMADFVLVPDQPPVAVSIEQRDGASAAVVSVGQAGFFDRSGLLLKAMVTDPELDSAPLEVEVRPVRTAFPGVATRVAVTITALALPAAAFAQSTTLQVTLPNIVRANFTPGSLITVPVSATTTGDLNAFDFMVYYDYSILESDTSQGPFTPGPWWT